MKKLEELTDQQLMTELTSRGYNIDNSDESELEEYGMQLSDFTDDEIIEHIMQNGMSIKYDFLTSQFANGGQRMQYYCLCDLFGMSHLSPKKDVLAHLSSYFNKIK